MKTKKINLLFKIIILTFSLSVFITSCEAELEVDKTVEEILSAQPSITGLSNETAEILTKITITGSFLNFAEKAYVGNTECQITQRINGETLEIEVAPSASTGVVKIVTTAGKEAVSNETLTVTYPIPLVTSTFPSSASVNENIIIEGANLNSISRISFGSMDGVIQFKEEQAIVVSVPNNENSPLEVNYFYNTTSGVISQTLSSSFKILIPTPNINSWPDLMNRDNEVVIVGEDMNLITGISIAGEEAIINELSSTTVSFYVPSNVNTGYKDIDVKYGSSGVITKEDVPYINGQFENYIEFDSYSSDVFSIDLRKDPLAIQQINGNVSQPPFPGSSYYNLQMNTGTGSTIARMRLHRETNNDSWSNILDSGNFNDSPVLHFWMNSEGAEPIFKLYIGGTASANRRQLSGSNTNTGNDWKLFAVRLKGFIPSISEVGSTFELRFNTGSGASVFPISVNLDWIIVTDSILTEFGAEDVTDLFSPAG